MATMTWISLQPDDPNETAVVKSQGEDGRLRDADGIACPAKRPATDGWAGAWRDGWLLAEKLVAVITLGNAAIRDDHTNLPSAARDAEMAP